MSQNNFYLLFKSIKIQQANAISSPITYGFPAISHFIGATHRLNRTLNEQQIELKLDGILIACHNYELQAYRPYQSADYNFNQTRNPLTSEGKTAPIIEEGKIHLEISLIIETKISEILAADINYNEEIKKELEQKIQEILYQQRLAGGSIIHIASTKIIANVDDFELLKEIRDTNILMDASKELLAIQKEIQTGHKHSLNSEGEIIELQDENQQAIPSPYPKNPNATPLDALIETAILHHIPLHENAEKNEWQVQNIKKQYGHLVPIPIGYQAISPLYKPGVIKNARTPNYPCQFVETIYSLGKWLYPTQISQLSHCFWRTSTAENNLYLIKQGA